MGFRNSQRKADSRRAQSLLENIRAGEPSVLQCSKLQSCNQYYRGGLQLTRSEWQQLPETEKRSEDRYDLVAGFLCSALAGQGTVIIFVVSVPSVY